LKYLFLIILLFIYHNGCVKKKADQRLPTVHFGRIERIEDFKSKHIDSRNIDVWLPEDYSEDEYYPSIYMHDGQMLFDSNLTWNKQEWGVDEKVGGLIEQQKINKCIVIGISNINNKRHSDYCPQKPIESFSQNYQDSLIKNAKRSSGDLIFVNNIKSDNYLKFIVKELKPYIDKNYSTKPDRENTFIMGSSMGGLISIYAICEYPKIFGGAACLSTHWTVIYRNQNNPIPEKIYDYLENNLPDPLTHKIYFDYGTKTLDSLYEPHQLKVDSIMVEKGYNQNNWRTLKFRGENHSESAWRKRLHIPLTYLLKTKG